MLRRVALASSIALLACGGGQSSETTSAETDAVTQGTDNVTDATVNPSSTSSEGTGAETSATGVDSGSSEGSSGDTSGGDPSTSDGSGSTTDASGAPTVVAITPADRTTGLAPLISPVVEFSEPMDPATITLDDGSCTGAIQLSSDDFATCVPLQQPTSPDDVAWTFQLGESLASMTTYRIRVTTDVTDAGGTPLLAEHTMPLGFQARYFHTIEIDGAIDFTADETFSTSTVGHTAHLAWDDQFLYVAMDSPDVGSGSSDVWLIVYLGGANGTLSGEAYNTQQPMLPFPARWTVAWRADNQFVQAREYDGNGWVDAVWNVNPGDVYQADDIVELRISLFNLVMPDPLPVHVALVREQDLQEATWAACPQGSLDDGYDPDYGQYFSLQMEASTWPVDHVALP